MNLFCIVFGVPFFFFFFFFFNDTATTEIYTLSLHDALPIGITAVATIGNMPALALPALTLAVIGRSEEHTSELQSRENLVCRLLLEKKKKQTLDHLQTKQKNKKQKK